VATLSEPAERRCRRRVARATSGSSKIGSSRDLLLSGVADAREHLGLGEEGRRSRQLSGCHSAFGTSTGAAAADSSAWGKAICAAPTPIEK